uniref:Tetraspanin n=1 Tax=Parascaris univalens TaxID=6257 RepID=A0A915C766_PARUN
MAGGCLNTLRSVVFLFNLFFWLAGLGTLGLGLWLRFDGAVSELIALHGGTNNFNIACYLLIAAGALMSLIGFLGCCGAWRLSQGMLVAFFIILVLVFCLELACAIVAYSHQDLIRRYIDNSMYETIQEYYAINPEYAAVFDRIQNEFECCGVKSYRDWLHSSWGRDLVGRTELGIGSSSIGKVPRSCCNEDGLRDYPTNCGVSFDKLELWTYEPFLHTKGCSDALYESAYKNLDIAIATSVIIGALQLIGMFLSMLLCCWIGTEAKRSSDY